MAESKKQHYVPQFYLRNFSKDGKTIGCCHCKIEEKRSIIINEAPIKFQACKDYFYTKDVRLEKEFSKVEGQANILIKKILSSEQIRLTAYEEESLKQYIFFQHIRTPFYANEHESMMVQFYHQIAPEDKDVEIKLEGKQIFVLQTFLPKIAEFVKPFRAIILENKTDLPFVTSPEPVILLNPYQIKRKNYIFGSATHGSMYYIPLSSKKAIILYNPLAYKMKGRHMASCSLTDVAYLNIQIVDFVGRTKINQFFFDNNIVDFRPIARSILQYGKEVVELSFAKERVRIWELLRRRLIIRK